MYSNTSASVRQANGALRSEALDMPTNSQRVELEQIRARTTITIPEAASLLGIGRTAAYEAARRGELPTRRLGRRLVVPVPWLLSWLAGESDAGTHS
jgi:excisionase family DNA binding protein